MDTAIFAIGDDVVTAHIASHMGGEEVSYHFDDRSAYHGAIMTKPARFGIHPRCGGVMIVFGGYGGLFEIGDWGVKGTATCHAPDMMPTPHSDSADYPIDQISKDDPAAAESLTELARTIADHYSDNYTGVGLR